ncbi:MAG: hypothetical protein H7A22_10795 [Spirochaetales bacterium]|nr:hypothetical protein [Spirochaetales bacterium]
MFRFIRSVILVLVLLLNSGTRAAPESSPDPEPDGSAVGQDAVVMQGRAAPALLPALFFGEVVIAALAWASTVENGNKIMGAVFGGSTLLFASAGTYFYVAHPDEFQAIFQPALSIPYALGLGLLSAHNYLNLDGASRSRRFRENFYGLSASILGALLVATLTQAAAPEAGEEEPLPVLSLGATSEHVALIWTLRF